jgi:3-phosphoinositide dependent protein kinase-1
MTRSQQDTRKGSISDVKNDINDIYNAYGSQQQQQLQQQNRGSQDTLDENIHGVKPPNIYKNHPLFVTSRLSSLEGDTDQGRSSLLSPAHSTGGFEFNLNHHHHALTNSSLNVLLDDTTDENSSNSKIDQNNWQQRGAAVKKIHDSGGTRVVTRSVGDFKFGKQLGEGSYSTVVLGTDQLTKKQYAIKILDKRHIIKEKKVKYVNIEKHALNRLANRMGIISLYFTFQDKSSLYFVLDYASNGELLSLIKKYNTLNEDCTRHFGAQILDAIKYMHDNGVIHRDIKPENILLDDKMRIQITDFGTARLLEKKNDASEDYPVDVRAKSFVGTAEYVSPELLESKYCGKPGDIWAFGCIIYQMIAGKPPFRATNEYLTFQKITKLQYAFSAGFPLIIRDLIKKILVLQPSKRATIDQIQEHHFFSSVNFDNFDEVWNTQPPEITPYKMTAKSMLKVPELQKAQSASNIHVRRPLVKRASEANVKPRINEDNSRSASTGNSSSSSVSNDKVINAATAAAFALNKKDVSPEHDEETRRSSSSNSRAVPEREYIPGTKILRPVINSRSSFSPSITKKSQANLKPKSRVMEVGPKSSVEMAWNAYLGHPDERVLKIGPVIIHREKTEILEKKHKGQLHNTPVALTSRLQANDRNGASGGSFLTKVINGSSTGLRGFDSDEHSHLLGSDSGDESKAIIDYFEIEEVKSSKSSENQETKETKIGKRPSLFKKLLHTGSSINNNAAFEPAHRQHPLDKARTCTVLITTYGRVLIFFRNDQDANYKLISEIKLNYPFIQLKEIISNLSKFSKVLPPVGVFAIMSKETSFVFEVEKYEVNIWTEALAKSKINQYEREKEASDKNSMKSNQLIPTPIVADSSKSLNRDNKPNSKYQESPKSPQLPFIAKTSLNDENYSKNMMANYSKPKSLRRKPPPQSSPTIDMSTGFDYHTTGESEFLHAAQLAVLQSPTNTSSHNERKSNVSRENSGTSKSKNPTSNNGSKPMVTSMNSKLLARSTRKKH